MERTIASTVTRVWGRSDTFYK